ncbi:MAG: DUF4335 domain-containing protein [Cyanobacteria bacterium P01_H01_bin.130]
MNIRRQYSLPSCILTLDGLDTTGESGASRPCLSVLLQVKCQFPMNGAQGFECDRDFFELFARTISLYGQQVISGVRSPSLAEAPDIPGLDDADLEEFEDELGGDGGTITQAPPAKALEKPAIEKPVIVPADGPIQVYPIGPSQHRLWIQPPPMLEGDTPPLPLDLEMTTLQLFDVVEVVDQFYADNRTLPDVSLGLSSVSRREVANREPLAQRVLPAVIGTTSLAAAAGVMFLLPHPATVERPEDVYRDAEELNQPALPVPGAAPQPPQGTPGSEPTLTPLEAPPPAGATDGDEGETDDPSEDEPPEESDQSSSLPGESAAIAQVPGQAQVSGAQDPNQVSGLDGEPEIFDPVLLRTLNTSLRNAIDGAWSDREAVSQDLEYRVGVSADGKVVGYRPVNEPAKAFGSDKLPLQKILFNPVPTAGATKSDEPLAVFKVVLTGDGIPQVSPLRGFQGGPNTRPAERGRD